MQSQPYVLLAPTDPKAVVSEWITVAIESHQLGRYADAERQLRHAICLDPNNPRIYNNLACAYAAGQNYKEAMLSIERASSLADIVLSIKKLQEDVDVRPNQEVAGIALCNWALIYLDLEQIDKATEKAKSSVVLHPCVQTRMALALCCPISGRAEEALPLYNAILDEHPKHFVAAVNACFVQTLYNAEPKQLRIQRNRFYEAQRQVGTSKKHHKLSLNGKPIRVGYVSGDYRRHSASSIFGGVVLHHSPRITPYLYSTQPVDPEADKVSKKFKDFAGDRWHDISGMTDEHAEERIRKDKIDILVDLSGHTGGGRLALFTRKPAPIQATAWGFAHGTGCPEIDYFLADPIAVPYKEREHYAEKVVDLPCIVTFEPPEFDLPASSLSPFDKNRYVTFGCYSRYEKLSTAYLCTCQDILREVPTARMIFKDNAFRQPYAVRRVLEIMDRIDPRRLSFLLGSGQGDHLLSYQLSDLILDPFPHSGGTACLEQLWMGVPLLTLYGTQAAGRTASSVLRVLNHPDWTASTRDEYIIAAINLVESSTRISKNRNTLREELLRSPIVEGYVGEVEKLYESFIRERVACATTK